MGVKVGTITLPGENMVSFRVGNGAPTDFGTVAQVGAPQTAFAPDDTPTGGNPGELFLSDNSDGPDYFIQFIDSAVSSVSLDLYDFRGDGGASAGDTATLTVYSDALTTAVGSTSYTIPSPLPPDGNTVTLSISTASAPIKWAALTFSTRDAGTGIDNVTFWNVPEPASFGSALAGSALFVGMIRRGS